MIDVLLPWLLVLAVCKLLLFVCLTASWWGHFLFFKNFPNFGGVALFSLS